MGQEELSPAAEIRLLAGMLVKSFKRDLEQRLDSRGVHLGTLPYGVMRLLQRREHTLSELSRHMVLSPATLVPVIDALEREGLVRRGSDPTDRRRTPISLTDRGADLLTRVPLLDRDDALAKGLDAMGEEKTRQLLQLLRELTGHMPGCPPFPEEPGGLSAED